MGATNVDVPTGIFHNAATAKKPLAADYAGRLGCHNYL